MSENVDSLLLGFAAARDSLWAVTSNSDQLLRIDPDSFEITARTPLPGINHESNVPVALTAGDGAIWIRNQDKGQRHDLGGGRRHGITIRLVGGSGIGHRQSMPLPGYGHPERSLTNCASRVEGGKGGVMRGRSAFLTITGSAVAGLLISAPATAKPIDKGHFHDVSGHDFICETTGTPAHEDADVSGNFLFNQRGSSPFPYYRESVKGTVVWTNLDTGGTFSNVFTASRRDHTITDNGDGTITIDQYASGGSKYYDQFGNMVLKDPGNIRFAFEIDLNGTPTDYTDDFMVENSFRVIRDSTGRTDTTGDFCEDLVRFTT